MLFTNMQKQQNMLKSSLLYKKNTLEFFGLRMQSFQVIFLWSHAYSKTFKSALKYF